MTQIFAHVTGLNDEGKKTFIKAFSKSYFYILDLDDITCKIISDKNMNYLYERYEYYQDKISDGNSTRIQQKQYSTKIKELERKMNLYWKSKMDAAISNSIKNITNKKIILIGYSTYFKNHKIGININTNLKLFHKIDLLEHAKNIVKYNLENYKEDIINGTFLLDYLNHNFIIKKRDNLINQYQKLGYQYMTLNNIINTIHIAENNQLPNILYVASKENYSKKLPLINGRIVAYEEDWIAIISGSNNKENNIKKGYIHGKPFIKGNTNYLKKPIYLYLVTDTKGFTPLPSKNKIYKYSTTKQIAFSKKTVIYDALKQLENMNIRIETI